MERLPLRLVLIVPFVIQLMIVVGLTGWLSWKNGQEAVSDVTTKLRSEITERIYDHLKNHMDTPPLVNQLNANVLETNMLDLQNKEERERFFYHQIKSFPDIAYTFIGTTEGHFFGTRRMPNGDLEQVIVDNKTGPNSHYYTIDPTGVAEELTEVFQNYDPRTRPWYQAAVEAEQPTWSGIYRHFVFTDLAITSAHPLYNKEGTLYGVLGVDYVLSGLNDFLNSLQVGETGMTYIMERNGQMIATSTMERTFRMNDNGTMKRLMAVQSSTPVVAEVTNFLESYYGSLESIYASEQLEFSVKGEKQYIQVTPFQEYGLDWLILCVVPEKDFMGYIQKNTEITLYLIGAALLIAILVGIATSQWVIRPIVEMNDAAKEYAKGKWNYPLQINRDDEVGQLGKTFQQMAKQLAELFGHLEDKVEERTRELEQKNEELIEANQKKEMAAQAKAAFLANMSHEIRTPMNAILGFTEIMQDQVKDEQEARYLNYISSNGETLLRIINDILDLSKIEAGRIEIQHRPTDLKNLFNEVQMAFLHLLEAKGVEMKMEIASNIPAKVMIDDVRLRQVLFNLLGNAVKFTHSGYIAINVQQGSSVNADGTFDLIFAVQDSGIGIEESQKQAIFDAFVQQKGQDTGQYGGTGLGLAITKRLVEIMDGSITVESEVGQGSTFQVLLRGIAPVQQVSAVEDGLDDIDTEKIRFSQSTLLIVDDIETNRQLLKDYLQDHNLRVIEAKDGREALESIALYQPQLILLDMKLPILSGYEVMEVLQMDDELSHIPVVACTASVLEEEEATVRKAGCVGFLRKPVSKKELVSELARFLPYEN
ncbi:response regulator [Heliorestis acidaminivorans]|uniref:Circadian input-output histidine kinase CikA n=1 Tax=Heliorestis acidaminivorans TaxID=553427 RepID=A0A6I0F0M5_9FIRM|nr:hybrid sensor histidine kinase/response regulator [Heliorestis acidaminivorans]KAB2952634.1 response regulator [Heliorestis acidaminivorans]